MNPSNLDQHGVACSGWLANAKQLPSPNFGPRPEGVDIHLIVIHSISLPPGEYGTGQVENLFTNQIDWNAHPYFKSITGLKVSAHFFIDRQGSVTQFVSCNNRAWHAGVSSHRGQNNCNDFSIGIELEGLEGQCFENNQYISLASLCHAIKEHYPITHVAGHEHIAAGRKSDPGSGFDWHRLRQMLNWTDSCWPVT